MTRARGADFSSWQDERHFAAALGHGLDFGFVKLTQGTRYVYKAAGDRLHRLADAGCVIGVYHYLEHGNAVAQWHHFADQLDTLPADLRHGLLVAVDYEERGTTDADARTFVREGKRRGWRVGCYSSAGTHAYSRLGQVWRWVAKWSKTPPARSWRFWQFAAGVDGAPDWDVYNGPPAELHKWAAANVGPGRFHVFAGDVWVRSCRAWRWAALAGAAYAIRHPATVHRLRITHAA